MLDSLDRQILETINKAPLIVRSVTEREIRGGVLLPSVTTVDIKRNLPRDVDVRIIEGRLRALEGSGYIYYEEDRWWLTTEGKKAIGIVVAKPADSDSTRRMLDETFSRFEVEEQKPGREEVTGVDQLEREIGEAKDELLRATRVQGRGEALEPRYEEMMVSITERLNLLDRKLQDYISKRKEELLKEVEELELELARKRRELDHLRMVQEG